MNGNQEGKFDDNMWAELAHHTERPELKPEQKADFMMAAQLNELVRDFDNAASLYKAAGEVGLADEKRALAAAVATEKAPPKINPHLEKLIKKLPGG